MKAKPYISIIMNCYNCEEFLKESIESVLSQSYSNWEVIFWDNQSKDNSADIFNKYVDKRLKYFYAKHHTNLGKARNRAIDESSGDWIAFLDCDDTWLKNKLCNQVEVIDKDQNLGLVYGAANVMVSGRVSSDWAKKIVESKVQKKAFLPHGDIFNPLLFNNFIYLSSAIVRRDAFYRVGGIGESYRQAEDLDLFLKISSKYKVGVFEGIVVNYRVHENNMSSCQKDTDYKETIDIISKYKQNKSVERAIAYCHIMEVYFHLKNKRIKTGLNIFKKINKIQLLLTINVIAASLIKKITL
jgi:glycosyltransferase involved in cell wall biosynthesis